ncbi:MAG: choice-of-anchor D domain-containing protein [Melioribacteraceae bacterium]|nr:choice-of-anchor D domain-containing protein [Melioribacteraceae bacterium]MCF8353388.1 choice-of-anchor D domain-containing protein [Melioribacteraceae bacterium]MCF8393033.1 choice-of-anchor D domain-containing protein [Melioribacteraceae bacterium]MCF8419114.1 choice-of-anchor D domain-containing protein [Melioribacteraceae bacterium]
MRKLLSFILILVMSSSFAWAQQNTFKPKQVLQPFKVVKTKALRDITPNQPTDRDQRWKETKRQVNNFEYPFKDRLENNESYGIDPVLQQTFGTQGGAETVVNFEGVGNENGVAPPDNQGDVGPNHYLQMINLSFEIFDKAGNSLYGPADNSTIWSELGDPSVTSNDGDPIVLYDQLADRWLVSQFFLPNVGWTCDGPWYELIAVSATPDPLGEWYIYAYETPYLPDYPKLGVWPDGYYMTYNAFSSDCYYAGAGVAVLDREAMLAGDPADMILIEYGASADIYSPLPSDLDGTLTPPEGTPNYIFYAVDDGSNDRLDYYEFETDWSAPANTQMVGPYSVPTEPFDMNMCGGSRDCIPQPSPGVNLDALSSRLMFRLQYRYFGPGDERIVANHTVDADGSDHAGIRWYELRNDGSGWSMYQQGTYAPDSDHRWMGSIAMDGQGNIALGYSVSSTSTKPAIRYTGRPAGAPLGEMTYNEETIIEGTGVETGVNRWGDYTMMTVDPTDDATFWYTNQYIASNGSFNWSTRVAAFSFEQDEVAPDPITDLATTNVTSNTIGLTWTATGDDGIEGTAASYQIRYHSEAITAVNWDDATSVPNSILPQASGETETYTVEGLDPATTYYFAVKAVDNLGNPSEVSNSPSGTTNDAPVISVDPTSLYSNLTTGQSEVQNVTVGNTSDGASDMQYMVSIGYGGGKLAKPAPLTDAQIEKTKLDKNPVVGNGIYPTLYMLGSKEESILFEDFEGGVPPADWTVIDNETDGVIWKTNTDWGAENKTGGTGYSATVDADAAGSGIEYDTELITPEISVMGRQDVYLSFKAYYNNLGSTDFFNVDITEDGGANWTTIMSWNEDHTTPEVVTLLLDDYTSQTATSIQIRFHYFDTGTGDWNWDVQIDDVEIVGGSAWLAVSPTEGLLYNGEEDVLDVTFSAVGLFGGAYNGDLIIASNDPVNPEVTVACSLDVTGATNIVVEPDTLDYGTVFVGDTSAAIVTVSNTGTDDLVVSDIVFGNTDYWVDSSSFTVSPGESQEVMVYFAPSDPGESNDVAEVQSNDPDEPSVYVDLFGAGATPPIVDVTPTSLYADLLTGGTQDTSITVYNTADVTGADLEFLVSVVYPGKLLKPKAEEFTSAQLQKMKNDFNKVRGNGIYPKQYVLAEKEDALLFEDFEGGVPPADWTVIDNETDGVIWKTNEEWGAENKTGGTGLSATVDADAAGSGIEYDTELITPSISVMGRQDVFLTFKAYYNNLGSTDFFNVDISEDGGANWTTIMSWNEDHTTPEVVTVLLDDYLSPTAANVQVRFHYFDTGDGDWNWDVQVDDVEIVGGSAWLVFDPASGLVAPGENTSVDVGFNAAGLYGGQYTADLVVASNDPITPEFGVACTLDVTGAPDITLDTDSLDYGIIFVNGVDSMMVEVSNTGTDDLTISDIASDNPDYTVDVTSFTLAPTEKQDVTVYFAPDAQEVSNGTLTVSSDDPDEPTVTVTLLGEGVNPPIISLNPTSLSADLLSGETDVQSFRISNDGEYNLDFTIDMEDTEGTNRAVRTRISKVHIPRSDGNFERGSAPSSFRKAPETGIDKSYGPLPSILEDENAYANNLFDNMFQYFDVSTPGTLNDLAASIGTMYAGDIDNNDNKYYYAIVNDTKALHKFDLESLTLTEVGVIPSFTSEFITGMESGDGPMYLSTYNETAAVNKLYTINLEDATVEYIGEITGAGIIIAIGMDDMGNLYGHDLDQDVIYYIDKNTAAGTVVGSTGFDANYAQGMGWNHATGEMYLAAYNNATSAGELRVVDLETGATAALGSLGAGDEMDGLSFKGSFGGDWLATDIDMGTVAPGSYVDVEVTFDATGVLGGTYYADIVVASNDPVTPEARVACDLTVTGAPNIEVSSDSLDFEVVFYGDEKTVDLIVGNTGTDVLDVTGVTSDNADFEVDVTVPFSLGPGMTLTVPVTFTASGLGIASGTLTIVSNDPGEPSYDVDMMAEVVDPPVIAVDPTSISHTMYVDESVEDVLTISNNGGYDLDFYLEMEEHSVTDKVASTVLMSRTSTKSSPNVKRPVRANVPERNVDLKYGITIPNSELSVLVLSPDGVDYIGDLVDALSAYEDLSVDQFVPEDLADLDVNDLLEYAVVLVQNDLLWSSPGGDRTVVGDVLADYLDAGGMVVVNLYAYSYDDWGLAGRFIDDGYGPFTGTTSDVWWNEGDPFFTLGTVHDAGHDIMQGVTTVEDNWGHQDPALASGATRIVDWNDGEILAAVNEDGTVVGLNLLAVNGNEGFNNDMITLIHNSILFLGGGHWMGADILEGTVAPGSSMEVNLLMNSTGMEEGEHLADIYVYSNDPANPMVTIPVVMDLIPVSVDGELLVPKEYGLSQNYPNPFNPSTTISFGLPTDAKVTLKLFDILGQEVVSLVGAEYKAGTYRIKFNASNLSSGVYLYQIRAEGFNGTSFVDTKKLILMK